MVMPFELFTCAWKEGPEYINYGRTAFELKLNKSGFVYTGGAMDCRWKTSLLRTGERWEMDNSNERVACSSSVNFFSMNGYGSC